MSDLIIIRLHPDKPIDGATFTNYLTDLKIAITDMSIRNMADGTLLANPQGRGNPIGSAFYDPTDPNGTIVQHIIFTPLATFASVATAVIAISVPPPPPLVVGYPEYPINGIPNDLRLTITRGTQTIVDRSLNYNVDVDTGTAVPATQDPFQYAALAPTALYLALPDPLIGVDPAHAFVNVPTDGSPPNFDDLMQAVAKVYAADPGGVFDINSPPLTAGQARHIAYEILWNRTLNPLPVPPDPIEELYTVGPALAADSDRQKFESDLLTYSTTLNTQAETLAKYVFALSAALACENETNAAPHAGFAFPVLPGLINSGAKSAETDVILSG